MSKKFKKKLERDSTRQAEQESGQQKVLMRFGAQQFYNDLNTPMFESGKLYVLEGADWIERWLKRGGEIVSEEQALKDKNFDIDEAPVSTRPGPSTLLRKAEQAAEEKVARAEVKADFLKSQEPKEEDEEPSDQESEEGDTVNL